MKKKHFAFRFLEQASMPVTRKIFYLCILKLQPLLLFLWTLPVLILQFPHFLLIMSISSAFIFLSLLVEKKYARFLNIFQILTHLKFTATL